jgi:hypothetical protein
MKERLPLGYLAFALLGLVSGCTPDIGAACTTSTNCSSQGDRTCDTTMPGGYCTIPNCEPDTCPSEASCVAFRQWPSAVAACQDPTDTRMLRTFCMVRCESNGDCRAGYSCEDINASGNPWGASLADHANRDGRICIVPGAAPQAPGQPTEYCQSIPTDAGLPPDYLPDANLPDANLPDANLPDANLPDANLPDANLPDANLSDASSSP